MNSPKRIQFPGLRPCPEQTRLAEAVTQVAGTGQLKGKENMIQGLDMSEKASETKAMLVGPDGKPIPMDADQLKALDLIIKGLPFVFIAMKPTPNGCDFYSACSGPAQDLTDHYVELPAMIKSLYQRKGLL
jgi:hypothetical protein